MMPANISVESRYCTREALYRGARRLPSLKWPRRNADCRSASGKSPISGRVTGFGRSTAGPAPPAHRGRARTPGPRPPWPDRRSLPGHRASLPCPARPEPCAATMPDLRHANAPPPQGVRPIARTAMTGPAAAGRSGRPGLADAGPSPFCGPGLADQNVRSRNCGPRPLNFRQVIAPLSRHCRPQRAALAAAVRHRNRPRSRPCMNARIAPGARARATAAMPPAPRTGPARRPGRAAPVRSARCRPARAGRPAPRPPGAPGRPDRPGRTEP
jgi:hypothetical protein